MWCFGDSLLYVGIVLDCRLVDGVWLLIVYNVGVGIVFEDVLFEYLMYGYYCYYFGVDG